jgi:hypothetical protein
MPLPHATLSHGTVAFGFFNIESSMLLLQQLFFFAEDFCQAVQRLAAAEDTGESGGERASFSEAQIGGWQIEREAIGDLHGAIAGADLSGFIGATYARFPFPSEPEGFKQNPEGQLGRPEVERMIRRHGQAAQIIVGRDLREGLLQIGPRGAAEPFVFSEVGFARLVAYVERGGHPRWKDERRPPYVLEMMQRLDERRSPLRPERG